MYIKEAATLRVWDQEPLILRPRRSRVFLVAYSYDVARAIEQDCTALPVIREWWWLWGGLFDRLFHVTYRIYTCSITSKNHWRRRNLRASHVFRENVLYKTSCSWRVLYNLDNELIWRHFSSRWCDKPAAVYWMCDLFSFSEDSCSMHHTKASRTLYRTNDLLKFFVLLSYI